MEEQHNTRQLGAVVHTVQYNEHTRSGVDVIMKDQR